VKKLDPTDCSSRVPLDRLCGGKPSPLVRGTVGRTRQEKVGLFPEKTSRKHDFIVHHRLRQLQSHWPDIIHITFWHHYFPDFSHWYIYILLS